MRARPHALGEGYYTAVQPVGPTRGSAPPEPVNHAKQVGTNLTACGLNALNWPRLWNRPFPTAPGRQCPACLDLLIGRVPPT